MERPRYRRLSVGFVEVASIVSDPSERAVSGVAKSVRRLQERLPRPKCDGNNRALSYPDQAYQSRFGERGNLVASHVFRFQNSSYRQYNHERSKICRRRVEGRVSAFKLYRTLIPASSLDFGRDLGFCCWCAVSLSRRWVVRN
jgi:hypothetical protein